MPVPDALRDTIAQLNDRWGLAALWLFGSRAMGMARPDSDWDLAALFNTKPDPLQLLALRGELEVATGLAIDIIDLDRASPIVAYQVAKQGQLLVDNDPRRRINFIAHVPGRYEDLRIVRRGAERALVERISRG